MRNEEEEKAFVETVNYLYQNPILRFLHKMGHRVIQGLENKEGEIIDLGCGTGEHFPYLEGRDFIGVDIDDDLLKEAKQRFPQARVQKEDIYCLSFANESFDTAVASWILEHLDNLDKALSEIERILKPEGELIVLLPTENFLYRVGRSLTTKRHIEKMYNVSYDELIKKEHVNKYEDIVDELEKRFKIKKKVGIPFLIPLSSINMFMAFKCQK